jgi:uncharacterized cupin superfamily protein
METLLRQLDDLPVRHGEGALFGGFSETRLAKAVGLTQFGVNSVTLEPGSQTALRHWHEAEDEFVFVLSGVPTLVDENGEHALTAGSIVGFPAGVANAHQIVNRSGGPAQLLVVGSRKTGQETIHYPDDDFGPIHK